MPQPIYQWISQGAKQGQSRTRPLPTYDGALSLQSGRLIRASNLSETRGPIWNGQPPSY
jgi:hypothetical protein